MSFWWKHTNTETKMATNRHLRKLVGISNRDDDYYTLYEVIEKHLNLYPADLFINKTIYLPCDALTSNFTQYFMTNFARLKLKKLIATHYTTENDHIYIKTKKHELTKRCEKGYKSFLNATKLLFTNHQPTGSFDSTEFIPYWKEADYIITNPPFSKMKMFLECLYKFQKYFLFIAPALLPYKSYYFHNHTISAMLCRENFMTPSHQLKMMDCVFINNFYQHREYKTFQFYKSQQIYNIPINRYWWIDPTFYKIIKLWRPKDGTFTRIKMRKKNFLTPTS